MELTLSVTGHRPPKLGGYQQNQIHAYVRQKIDEHLMRLQPTRVVCGMAQGVDFMTAELCIENDIPFTAAVPTREFASRWPPLTQEHYRYLLSRAVQTHIVSPEFTRESMRQRNRWMLEHSDMLLAVWDGVREGGTWMTINMAQHAGKQVVYEILPQNLVALARELWTRDQERREMARAAMEARHGRPHTIPSGTLPAPPLVRHQPGVRTPTVEELFQQINERIERGESLSTALRTVGENVADDLTAQLSDEGQARPTGARAQPITDDRDRFVPRRRIDVGEDE